MNAEFAKSAEQFFCGPRNLARVCALCVHCVVPRDQILMRQEDRERDGASRRRNVLYL
jgi:hypothetical protein